MEYIKEEYMLVATAQRAVKNAERECTHAHNCLVVYRLRVVFYKHNENSGIHVLFHFPGYRLILLDNMTASGIFVWSSEGGGACIR